MMSKKISDRLIVLRLFLGGLTILTVWLIINISLQTQLFRAIFLPASLMFLLFFEMLLVCVINLLLAFLIWTPQWKR